MTGPGPASEHGADRQQLSRLDADLRQPARALDCCAQLRASRRLL